MDHAIQEQFIFAKHEIVGLDLLNMLGYKIITINERRNNSTLFVKILRGQQGSINELKQLYGE